MSIVKVLVLTLVVSVPGLCQGYYDTDRIVWYDSHDHEGKWHLGAVELVMDKESADMVMVWLGKHRGDVDGLVRWMGSATAEVHKHTFWTYIEHMDESYVPQD